VPQTHGGVEHAARGVPDDVVRDGSADCGAFPETAVGVPPPALYFCRSVRTQNSCNRQAKD
jgi:hypothetical protein